MSKHPYPMSKEAKAAIITAAATVAAAIITALVAPLIIRALTPPTTGPIAATSPTTGPVAAVSPTTGLTVAYSPYGATPRQTMGAFCTDLFNGDYQAAYTLLAPSLQSLYSEQTFMARYYGTKCGANYGYSPYGNGQQISIVMSTGDTCTFHLLELGNGWAINEIVCPL